MGHIRPQCLADEPDGRAALASLTTLDAIDAGLLLPGHGEPFAGTPADAATQARSAGLR